MTRAGFRQFLLYSPERKLIFETINERVICYRGKQMSKENITINNSDSLVMDGRATLSKAALSMIAVLLVAVALGQALLD